jgi:tRNA-Thr(GGU) m(6)t(6)A37 methyltransferase TsaA
MQAPFTISMSPIGYVRNQYPQGRKPPTWKGALGTIEIAPRWTEALAGLEGFSHISVLCYLHLVREESPVLQIRSQGNSEMPLVGLFATRTPRRPNPISLSVVELVERVGNHLHVRNLDMYDGTAVLDIKPYLTRGDSQPYATAPEWLYRLWASHDEPG